MDNSPPTASSIVPRIMAATAVLAVHFITLLMSVVIVCSVVPRYVKFFDEANVALPAMTQQLIYVSFFSANYWYLLIFVGMAVDVTFVLILAMATSKRRWLLSVYSHLWLLAVILFLFWISIALCIPVDALTRQSEVDTRLSVDSIGVGRASCYRDGEMTTTRSIRAVDAEANQTFSESGRSFVKALAVSPFTTVSR